MTTTLHWEQGMLNPDGILRETDVEVGRFHPNLTSFNAEAWLYDTQVRFNVTGFLKTSVKLYDLNRNGEQVGTITVNSYDKAQLTLATGAVYTWRAHTATMSRWGMIQENSTSAVGKEDLSCQLTTDRGTIQVDLDGPEAALVVLSGLFVYNYFSAMSGVAMTSIAVG